VKVFLDTNVLVSAFATRGLCADLLRYVLAEHELLTGEVVLSELVRVLRVRIRLPADSIKAIEAFLREHSVVPRPRRHLALGLIDGDDEWVVASAVAASADVLVTGDSELLDLRNPPLRILNPRGLWELVRDPNPGT
jgi:putative PIN family toxin of toxin-antitoxin system